MLLAPRPHLDRPPNPHSRPVCLVTPSPIIRIPSGHSVGYTHGGTSSLFSYSIVGTANTQNKSLFGTTTTTQPTTTGTFGIFGGQNQPNQQGQQQPAQPTSIFGTTGGTGVFGTTTNQQPQQNVAQPATSRERTYLSVIRLLLILFQSLEHKRMPVELVFLEILVVASSETLVPSSSNSNSNNRLVRNNLHKSTHSGICLDPNLEAHFRA